VEVPEARQAAGRGPAKPRPGSRPVLLRTLFLPLPQKSKLTKDEKKFGFGNRVLGFFAQGCPPEEGPNGQDYEQAKKLRDRPTSSDRRRGRRGPGTGWRRGDAGFNRAACKAKWAFMRAPPKSSAHIRATGAPSVTASALRRLGRTTGHRHPLPPLLDDARHGKIVPLKQALFFEGLHIVQSLLAHPRPKPTLVQQQGFCRVLHGYGTFQMSGLIVSAPRMQSYKSMMARSPYLRKKIVFAELAVDTYPDAEVKGPVLAVSSSVVECPLSELCLPHPAMTNDGDDLSVTTSESGHEMAVLVFIPEELAAPSEWSRGGPWFGSDHELRDLEEIPRVRVQPCQQSLQLPQRLPAANN
ncbi:hypothetical protein U9M48_030474, partial [Paspalum notatum var. saurae]